MIWHSRRRVEPQSRYSNGSAYASNSRSSRRAAARCSTTPDIARRRCPLAEKFARDFTGFDAVVTPSGSCAAFARDIHPTLAPDAVPPPPVYDLTEFLTDVLGVEDVGAYFPYRVTYHPTCHSSRLLKLGDRPLRLLRAVEGLELAELPAADECCGFGGTFSVKNPDVSAAMGTDKIAHATESGAQYLAAADNSCLMHLGGIAQRDRAPIKTIHLAEILASTKEDA